MAQPQTLLRQFITLPKISAVFSDFAAPLQDLCCSPGADPEFLVSDTGQIFIYFSASELLTTGIATVSDCDTRLDSSEFI